MSEYRVYQLARNGKIHTPHNIVAEDDAEALARAMALRGSYGAEIWQGKRLVAQVPGLVVKV